MNWILTYSLKGLIRLGILFWSTIKSTQLTMGKAEDICKQKWGQLIRQFAYIWMVIFRAFFFFLLTVGSPYSHTVFPTLYLCSMSIRPANLSAWRAAQEHQWCPQPSWTVDSVKKTHNLLSDPQNDTWQGSKFVWNQ